MAWIGDVSAVLLIATVRTYRLIFNPEAMAATSKKSRRVE